jgi:hypothetical protein
MSICQRPAYILTIISHVLFAAANIDEVEEQFVVKSFCKSFKGAGTIDDAGLVQSVTQAFDVGVYTSDDLWRGQMWELSSNELVDGGPNQVGGLLASFLSFLDEILVKDHSISVKQDDDEGVPVL